MTIFSNTFGLAIRNFTTHPEMPDPQALIAYAVKAEELGFDSVWVWDHIFLGVDPPFPVLDSLTLLAAVAARTQRIKLGTGVLVLPLRNPVVLAKELSSLDLIAGGRLLLGMASGWYRREFDAVGVPFKERGRIMDRNLEILRRLWTEEQVDGEYPPHQLRGSNMSPKPPRLPVMLIGGYVERVLKRAALNGGWLTYFYTPAGFAGSWGEIRRHCSTPISCRSTSAAPARRSKRRCWSGSARSGTMRRGATRPKRPRFTARWPNVSISCAPNSPSVFRS
jgi:alkanesulfonate monooxygenase SsuD/methylene tetrahydromethanopterin reductase-like flavin-dependent oxidoreductase (luciferase family)